MYGSTAFEIPVPLRSPKSSTAGLGTTRNGWPSPPRKAKSLYKKCHRDGSGPSPAPDPSDAGSYPVTVAGTIPKWGNWSRRNPLKGLYSCVRTKERRVGWGALERGTSGPLWGAWVVKQMRRRKKEFCFTGSIHLWRKWKKNTSNLLII